MVLQDQPWGISRSTLVRFQTPPHSLPAALGGPALGHHPSHDRAARGRQRNRSSRSCPSSTATTTSGTPPAPAAPATIVQAVTPRPRRHQDSKRATTNDATLPAAAVRIVTDGNNSACAAANNVQSELAATAVLRGTAVTATILTCRLSSRLATRASCRSGHRSRGSGEGSAASIDSANTAR